MNKTDRLAESLSARFQQEIPLTADKKGAKVLKAISQKSAEQRLEEFYDHAREVRNKHRLWVISWARVVLKLQEHLTAAGYPPDLVSKLLMAMIFVSSRRH